MLLIHSTIRPLFYECFSKLHYLESNSISNVQIYMSFMHVALETSSYVSPKGLNPVSEPSAATHRQVSV